MIGGDRRRRSIADRRPRLWHDVPGVGVCRHGIAGMGIGRRRIGRHGVAGVRIGRSRFRRHRMSGVRIGLDLGRIGLGHCRGVPGVGGMIAVAAVLRPGQPRRGQHRGGR